MNTFTDNKNSGIDGRCENARKYQKIMGINE